jgi:hypothetical protein
MRHAEVGEQRSSNACVHGEQERSSDLSCYFIELEELCLGQQLCEHHSCYRLARSQHVSGAKCLNRAPAPDVHLRALSVSVYSEARAYALLNT